MQTKLSGEQVEAFYHDLFVDDQVRGFVSLLGTNPSCGNIVDLGGGCGFFAHQLKRESQYPMLSTYQNKVIHLSCKHLIDVDFL